MTTIFLKANTYSVTTKYRTLLVTKMFFTIWKSDIQFILYKVSSKFSKNIPLFLGTVQERGLTVL